MKFILALLITITSIPVYAGISYKIYGFPDSPIINLKELNLSGDIKTISKSGYTVKSRDNHKFQKINSNIDLEISKAGEVLKFEKDSEVILNVVNRFEGGKIKESSTKRHIKTSFDYPTQKTNTIYHYRDEKLYGAIQTSNSGKGCVKFNHQKMMVIKSECHNKNKHEYEYLPDGRIKSITTKIKLFDTFKDTYVYEDKQIKIIKTVKNEITMETIIRLDKYGNFIEVKSANYNVPLFGIGPPVINTRVVFDILDYDKYGNPKEAVQRGYKTVKGSEEKLGYESYEFNKYTYYNK